MRTEKPRFQFYFAHEPHRATYENRTILAWRLKSYRRQPENYTVRKVGLHSYLVRLNRTDLVACIAI